MFVGDIPVAHEDGSLVSEKTSRIIELIREYDSNLDVRWIPRAARTKGEAAFAIVEKCSDGSWRTAFLVQTEEEFDERILARIYNADQQKHGDVRIRLQDMQRAQKALKEKEVMEQIEEATDYSRFMIKTPKHRVQLSKNRFIDL